MTRVTIAVPVFNGGPHLTQALEAIRAQSFGDFDVVIFDNASTDETAAIAGAMVARDPRFRYFRQPENKGALANFVDALNAARSPYFAWHACDDVWDANYLEVLVGVLDANAQADLAVGIIQSTDLDGRLLRTARFPVNLSVPLRVLRAHPSWIYGLFRREPLTERVAQVWSEYRHPWAWDHLTLFPLVIRERIASTEATTFHQVIRRSKLGRTRQRVRPDLQLMATLRQRFAGIARRDIDALAGSPLLRSALRLILPVYIGKRVYRWRRMLYRQIAGVFSPEPKSVDEQKGFEAYY